MNPYSLVVCSNLMRDRLEVEIQRELQDRQFEEVALIFRTVEGWGIDYVDDAFAKVPDPEFDEAVQRAKELLGEYEDRSNEEPPEGLTAAGMAAWLMEKNEGPEE